MTTIINTNDINIDIVSTGKQGFIDTLSIRKKLIIYIDDQLLDGNELINDYQ